MSTPLGVPDITRLRYIPLALNTNAGSYPTTTETYFHAAMLRFRIVSTNTYYYATVNTSDSYHYSTSYSAYQLFDTNVSSRWYMSYYAYQRRVAIPATSLKSTWENQTWTNCHWAEGSFPTPIPYEEFVLGSPNFFEFYVYSSNATYMPTNFVLLGQDVEGEWHMLLDKSLSRMYAGNYSNATLEVRGEPSDPGAENDSAISGLASTSSGAGLACNWYMYVKSSAMLGKYNNPHDAYILSKSGENKQAAIHGFAHEISNAFRSSIWGNLRYNYDRSSALFSKTIDDMHLAIYGAPYNNRGCAINGGETFGSRYLIPLTDKIPLRLSCVWGEYKTVKAIPHLYGNVSIEPIPYGTDNKQFVVADHPIQSVQEVYVNDSRVSSYEFINTSDNTGHAIALITFVDPKETSDDIRVVCNGKIHPKTGGMLLNPAEILWDILANISELEITENDLADFRDTCYQLGIESNGGLVDADRTIRSQIDEVMLSVGGLWSGGMEGIAKVYPFSEVV